MTNMEEKDSINGRSKAYDIPGIITDLSLQSNDKRDEDDKSIRPSEYMKQMLFTTAERTDYLIRMKRKHNIPFTLDYVGANFEIVPDIIIFQRFSPGEMYNVTLSVRNTTQVLQFLKISYVIDPFFFIEFHGSSYSTMVAPGLCHVYNVQFKPDKNRDYEYQLKFSTDNGILNVPIIAIGPRAILDFPDALEIPSTGVKIPSSRTIMIRNIGNAPGVFRIFTNNSYFWMEPSNGRLEQDQTLQFTVHFSSVKSGAYEGKLFVEYESGEKLGICLSSSATNLPIRLERGSIRIEETYLGMSRSKTLTIHNRSDYVIKYQWMHYKDSDTENQRRDQYMKLSHLVYDTEVSRYTDLDYYNVCSPNVHQTVCQRIYVDEITSLIKENFRYKHTCFALKPKDGEIWPQTSTDVTVVFQAKEVGEMTSTAYLDVTGLDERIPLSLSGAGKGPILRLNVLTIDIGNVYLCSLHNYEVVATNKGHIAGTLVYKSKQTDFGGTINACPESLNLEPEEHKSFNLSFCSNRKGDFVERVDFEVKESLEILTLHIKGSIICPTLHFDKDGIDFGTTPLGCSSRQEVQLHNLSLVPVTFCITVLNDGDQAPLTYEEFAKAHVKPSFPSNPREFTVSPEEGVVPAHNSLKIKITYTANIAGSGHTILRVDMWDSDSDPVTLQIVHCGKVASLLINPVEISIRFSFLNFPYSRSLTMENTSDVDGYFYIMPQTVSENSPILYSMSMYEGFIKARQSKSIKVTIITRVLGRQETALNMITMGGRYPVVACLITCNGQGPVISAQPACLDFGEVRVLEEKVMKVNVISDAPIPASFTVALPKKNSPWSVNPTFGDIAPHASMEIEVKLYLQDSGKHSSNLKLLVVSSRSVSVYLKAVGVGCSIIFEPSIFPTFDMGLVLSHQEVNYPIVLKNLGTRHHQIAWSNESELRMQRGQIVLPNNSKFAIHPLMLDIPGGVTSTVHCKLYGDKKNECLQENWYVFGQVMGQGKRELIGASLFKMILTEPEMILSKKELIFQVDMCPDSDKMQNTDELLVTNRSSLDVNIQLSIDPPFYLITETEELLEQSKITLANGDTVKLRVKFLAKTDQVNCYSKTFNGTLCLDYEGHPNKDKIKCHGSVNYPNLTITPKDLSISCVAGCSAEKVLTLTNNGPVSVIYKFLWTKNSIRIESRAQKSCGCEINPELGNALNNQGTCSNSLSNEELDLINHRDGSGDERTRSVTPPANSSTAEIQAAELNSENSFRERYPETLEFDFHCREVKEFLARIVEPYFINDTEIFAFEALPSEPCETSRISEILDIIPSCGTILPYSKQHVHVAFYGFEPIEVKATAVCQIIRGPTEKINILASADTVQFSVDKSVINFGQQLFCEPQNKSIELKNYCSIPVNYKVERSIYIRGENEFLDLEPLKIKPNEGIVEPRSSITFEVEHRPIVLGPIDLQFKLNVAHLKPLVIEVKAIGTLPQVYLCIPRDNSEKHPTESYYSAIQLLPTDFILDRKEDHRRKSYCIDGQADLCAEDVNTLADDGWCVISYMERFPSIMDVEMAIERYFAKNFIEENSHVITQYDLMSKRQPIPKLYAPEYVINMGYITVGLTAHYSTMVINYGPWNVELQLRIKNKSRLAKSGVVMNFKKQKNLMVGESTALHITWHPAQANYTERNTETRHRVFLEVTHGCTIPIIIKGTVTYPHVSVNTKLLDFENVVVGECSMMKIFVRNDGLVDCSWNVALSNASKKQVEHPFYAHHDSNIYSPGDSEIIRVYFKPRSTCYAETKLNVIVKMGLESQTVTLKGNGIEQKLNITQPVIKFPPVVPFTEIQEKTFVVENISNIPVAFFWHHLESSFDHEYRIAKALTYYYQVEEILLPQRKLGEKIPELLTEFYNSLISEVAPTLSGGTFTKESVRLSGNVNQVEMNDSKDGEIQSLDTNNEMQKSSNKRRKSAQKNGTRGKSKYNHDPADLSDSTKSDYPYSSAVNKPEEEAFNAAPYLPPNDPEEIEKLLKCYIDALQKSADFHEKMKDPVGELFKSSGRRSTLLNNQVDALKPKKKVCIIFHGAPFTGYLETACRSARISETPVFSIDRGILEVIAFGNSLTAVTLRQCIDKAYQEFLEKYENYKELLSSRKFPEKEKGYKDAPDKTDEGKNPESKLPENTYSPKQKVSPKIKRNESDVKSVKNEADQNSQEIILQLYSETDPWKELDKIPSKEILESLDPFSRYEYKVEAITLLEKALNPHPTDLLTKEQLPSINVDKGGRKKDAGTFLGIDSELLSEALEERLSMEDLKRGFIVQSLRSTFLNDNIIAALLLLLRVVGSVEYFLFVTFLNSMDKYGDKTDELRELRVKPIPDPAKKIQDIDEMSLSEYVLLSPEDKQLYLDAVLPVKKEQALLRRSLYSKQLTSIRKKKELRQTSTISKLSKYKRSKKSSLLKISESINQDVSLQNKSENKSTNMKAVSSKKGSPGNQAKSRDSSKRRKESVPNQLAKIIAAMDQYYKELSAIEEIIQSWDPANKIISQDVSTSGSNKIKAAKSQNKGTPDAKSAEGSINEFHLWYVNSSDPWHSTMYNVIVAQINELILAKRAPHLDVATKPDHQPKMYSILKPENIQKPKIQMDDAYQLAPVSSMIDRLSIINETMKIPDITNNKEETVTDKKNRKKRRQKLSSKMEDQISQNTSTLESRGATHVTSPQTITEECVKPESIIQPNETQEFRIRFQPEKEGVQKKTYTLSIPNGNGAIYEINVEGVADIPRLDKSPEVTFKKIDTITNPKNVPKCYDDGEAYDFGSLLILPKGKRIHTREAEFKFRNISKVDAEVHFYLTGNEPGSFFMEPERLLIPAGKRRSLNILAFPVTDGPLSEKLHICIKNNPKVETIELRCEGSKLDVELVENLISFDRVLLYRREFRIAKVRNKSTVPLFWIIRILGATESQISFSPTKGFIKALGEQEIEFCYYGNKVGMIEKNKFILYILLYEKDDEPIWTDILEISGETYDVAVDINYANPIDLKCVKVGVPVVAGFTIKNRGNYEVKYVIMLEADNKLMQSLPKVPTNLRKYLDVEPVSGSIQPQMEEGVKMTFLPKTELALKRSPILKCHLLDTDKETKLIAELPLTVSLTTYYSRYRLYPYPTVDFGTRTICTESVVYLNIENIGDFPFHYSIHTSIPRENNLSLIDMSSTHKESSIKKAESNDKATDSTFRKDKKLSKSDGTSAKENLDTLTIGPMTIRKTKGEIDAGETDTITIECFPEFAGSQEEQITILVSDSSPEDRSGRTIKLFVNSFVPSIDFQQLGKIFQENHIVDYIKDFACPREIGAHTVFAREERCLYFRQVVVLKTHTTRIKLYNKQVIPADVEVLLSPGSETFTVEPRKDRIPAMCHKNFTVSFTPTLIEIYKAVLEVVVDMPAHLREEAFSIKLVGESCVPEVIITEPVQGKRERATLNFGRTLVTETDSKEFIFENVGLVPANIIVEVCGDLSSPFGFVPSSDTLSLLQSSENESRNSRCTVVRLKPNNIARFKAKFEPKGLGKHEGKIKLFIVDNPYEDLTIDLEGEAYEELIVLEGLEFAGNKIKVEAERRESINRAQNNASKQNSPIVAAPVYLTYNLDYGACFVSKMYKRTFQIANKSRNQCFRFQWGAYPHVVFEPSIGHLQHLTSKEITATFLSSNPANYTNVRIECIIYEIRIVGSVQEISWDDRQTEVRWEEMVSGIGNHETDAETLVKKVVEPSAEPNHEIIPWTTKSIQLLLNVAVAYSEYSCDIKEIRFKDTLMFQTRGYTFTLTNPGTANMVYAWEVNMDEAHPKKLNGSSSVTPRPQSHENIFSQSNTKSSKDRFSSTNEVNSANVKFRKCGNSKLHRFTLLDLYDTTIELKPQSSLRRPGDLFSSTAGFTERSTDSWSESDSFPFVMYPAVGTLTPGQSVECRLTFSPKDVFCYKAYLTCKIENLNPSLTELVIPIIARSLLPYCHFDVEESDYITSGKRDPKLPGPRGYDIEDTTLWDNIRVIEFKVIGIGETQIKKFHLINPTAEDYHFSWSDQTIRFGDEISNFHCLVPEGLVERGKRTELAFTFLAQDVGIFESFWLFSLKRYNLESLFLFVGVVSEPSVYCLTAHLKLKPTVSGISVGHEIRMINNEGFPLRFLILGESLYSEGKFQKLSVSPMSGYLEPRKEETLRVEYQSTRTGEFEFCIQCMVEKMKKPFTIFVSASCYHIESSVLYSDENGLITQAYEDRENIIDLGKLTINKQNTVKFNIVNAGKLTFYYSWDLGMTPEIINSNTYTIETSQIQGHVTSETQSADYLTLTALQKLVIKDHLVILKITKGATYRFILRGFVKKPSVDFNFDRHDFGPSYIQDQNSEGYRTELLLTNSDNTPFIIECGFEEVPHLSVDLKALADVLEPQCAISVPITFRPLKEIKYRECLIFKIHSEVEKRILIMGEGITYKIRLGNSRDKTVDLGNIPVNKTVMRAIPVINEGSAPIKSRFDLIKNLQGYKDYRQRKRACTKGSAVEDAKTDLVRSSISETKHSGTSEVTLQTDEPDISQVLRIEPSSDIILRPNKRMNVIVKFNPTGRMRPFITKVALQTPSTILPLFILRGSCVGAEFRLNTNNLSFGIVVQGCIGEAKVLLLNIGDTGARFKWNTTKLPKDFSITPISGYCTSGTDVNFVIKFQPIQPQSLIECTVSIDIERYGSLNLRITGGCYKLPEPRETLSFACNVRDKQTKSVTITNDTNLPWKLKPEVTGDFFTVEEVLYVSPRTTASCAITYAPKFMTNEKSPNKGMILFKLPEGKTPVLYSLHGMSFPPEVSKKIVREFPAKTKYTELLPVYNLLDRQQRFVCKTELINDNRTPSKHDVPLFNFHGNGKINVPPTSRCEYRADFYSYKEYNYDFKITFIADDGEYQFYEVTYKVLQPDVIESIKLTTAVRSPTCYTLQLENPLKNQPITFTAQCDCPYISVHETPKIVEPLSRDSITIRYYPLLTTNESLTMLTIFCEELGNFPYELQLKALPPPSENVKKVTAVLGDTCTFGLPIINYTKKSTEFQIEVNNDCFCCQKSVQVDAQKENFVDITFEPCDIENATATITFTSKAAGVFVYPLVGTILLPKPAGPYTITKKTPTEITFKNVFKQVMKYDLVLHDPDKFEIDTQSVVIKPKQDTKLKVKLRQQGEEDKHPVHGKLVVCCADAKFSQINWIYYLRGLLTNED